MPWKNIKYSRRDYRRGLLDYAYICDCCGSIRLGKPAVDPRDPPDPLTARCRDCGKRAWIESVVPAFDPSVLDVESSENVLLRIRRDRYLSGHRQPAPDYYSVETLTPSPVHSQYTRQVAPRAKGFSRGAKPATHVAGPRVHFAHPKPTEE